MQLAGVLQLYLPMLISGVEVEDSVAGLAHTKPAVPLESLWRLRLGPVYPPSPGFPVHPSWEGPGKSYTDKSESDSCFN